MENKKILKEAITSEQREELLSLSLTVEEAVLKLYKYVSTQLKDSAIQDKISSLKSNIAQFNFGLQEKAEAANAELNKVNNSGDSGSVDQIEQNNESGGDRGFLESVVKNNRAALQEHWKLTIDLNSEWKTVSKLNESSKPSKSTNKVLIEKLKSYSNEIGKTLSLNEQAEYESLIDNLQYKVSTVSEFNESFNRIYDWADKNNVCISTN